VADGDRITIRLPSRADWLGAVRSVVQGFLEECLSVRLPEEEIAGIQLALQEAAVNVVRHAHDHDASKELVLHIIPAADSFTLEIEDFGPGIPAEADQPPEPEEDPESPREGGYGLFMMRETMDEVRSEHRDGKHVLTLVKRLDAPGE
jgi:serine/threonine-protein kinase RsbW